MPHSSRVLLGSPKDCCRHFWWVCWFFFLSDTALLASAKEEFAWKNGLSFLQTICKFTVC